MPASRLAGLYEEHVGRAVALATLLTGDRAIAEDIAHDAFLRVAGRFRDLRDPGRLRSLPAHDGREHVPGEGPPPRTRADPPPRATPDPGAVEPDTRAEDRDEVWGFIKAIALPAAGGARPAVLGRPVRGRDRSRSAVLSSGR